MEIAEISKWLSIMYIFLTIAVYILKIIFTISIEVMALLFLSIVPILAIYSYFKAHNIIVKPVDLKIDNLNSEIKLIHISDLHIGSIRNHKLLKKIVKKINSFDADLVIISGDLADGSSPINEYSFLPLKDSRIPIIFTPGNHDYYPGIENVFKAAEKANIKILANSAIDFKQLKIVGIPFNFRSDDMVSSSNNYDLTSYGVNPTQPTLLINHVPINWEYFIKDGVDLQLSGHTHGGQFYPVTWLIKLVFPFSKGIFQKNGAYLSVSSGIGTLGPPMRLGTDAEMIFLRLNSYLDGKTI